MLEILYQNHTAISAEYLSFLTQVSVRIHSGYFCPLCWRLHVVTQSIQEANSTQRPRSCFARFCSVSASVVLRRGWKSSARNSTLLGARSRSSPENIKSIKGRNKENNNVAAGAQTLPLTNSRCAEDTRQSFSNVRESRRQQEQEQDWQHTWDSGLEGKRLPVPAGSILGICFGLLV